MHYTFEEKEYPFPPKTMLRYICKSTIMRHQHDPDTFVRFSDKTIVRMVVPSDKSVAPFITATCPDTGSCLRLEVHTMPIRDIESRNDAIAYLRRTMCLEAITVAKRDRSNIDRYGVRGHYTREFFDDLIAKYTWRVNTFHNHNYYNHPRYA